MTTNLGVFKYLSAVSVCIVVFMFMALELELVLVEDSRFIFDNNVELLCLVVFETAKHLLVHRRFGAGSRQGVGVSS